MPSEQDNTALAAIIIAVIAFFVTTAQLLQQIFGTAVGYRHCQASVIGDWATLTRRKWRWSEFRFETKFTTPTIRLVNVANCAGSGEVTLITGNTESRRKTYVRSIGYPDRNILDRDESGDQVGWLQLLDHLHVFQWNHIMWRISLNSAVDSPMEQITWPAITFRERSWDFMPPDIIRPFATSTVGDIIALAHRLGMRWTDLRPGDGIMRAEGGGKSIISTAVRGFGILLQFNYDRADRDIIPSFGSFGYGGHITIPSVPADKLGFGIIEYGEKHSSREIEFEGLDYEIVFEGANETEAAKKVMHALLIDKAVISKYGEYMEQSGNSLGFSDILGMWAPFMTFQGSVIAPVMKVHRDVDRGPTCSPEGFLVFHLRLEKYEKEGTCSEQMLYLLSTYRQLQKKWEVCWGPSMRRNERLEAPPEFLSKICKLWSEVMERLGSPIPRFIFELVSSHITQAVEYPELAKAALNDTAQRQKIEDGLDPFMDRHVAAGMHLYIDRIPLVVSDMKSRNYDRERFVIDAWWTLIFRAMLWHRGHKILEGKTRGYGGIPVSPTFWGSKLPVYIA